MAAPEHRSNTFLPKDGRYHLPNFTVAFMVTPIGTSTFVRIVMKNELPEKSFVFVLFRKDRDTDWHTNEAAQTYTHRNINRRNGFYMSRRWMPLIHNLKATTLQEFSNRVIELTSRGKQVNK